MSVQQMQRQVFCIQLETYNNLKLNKMKESNWEILKKKQAENIAKLAEKYPDD